MGDRIAILRDGALVQYDTPEAILARPADAFVESFVGTDRALKRLALIRARRGARAGRRRAARARHRRRGEPARRAGADVLRGHRRAGGDRAGDGDGRSGIVTLARIRARHDASPARTIRPLTAAALRT